jgi:hypothetical protein
MTVIAHIAGVPVEETALSLAPASGLLWLAARTWLAGQLRAGDTDEGTRDEPA